MTVNFSKYLRVLHPVYNNLICLELSVDSENKIQKYTFLFKNMQKKQ